MIVYDALGENREYSLVGYARPINVILTTDAAKLRSVLHREIELALEQDHPALARLAFAKKASGMKTEAAWASVLGLPGCPYVAMADRDAVRTAAATAAAAVAAAAAWQPGSLLLRKRRNAMRDRPTCPQCGLDLTANYAQEPHSCVAAGSDSHAVDCGCVYCDQEQRFAAHPDAMHAV